MRRLPRPPITEAIIDFQLESPLLHDGVLLGLQDKLKDFPDRREIYSLQAQVNLSSRNPSVSSPSPSVVGYQFWASDKRKVVQARRNGFSFSILAPYENWNELVEGAHHAWTAYAIATNHIRISRMAVRYVNRIALPLAGLAFEDYLRTFPKIAKELPQSIGGLFMRLVLPRPADGVTTIVTEAFDRPSGDTLPVILDIDVVAEGLFEAEDADVWARLGLLRKIKNEVFENCLTDRAMELFQ